MSKFTQLALNGRKFFPFRFRARQRLPEQADLHPPHAKVCQLHAIVRQHPFHTIKTSTMVAPDIAIVSSRKIEDAPADIFDSSGHMKPVQAMLALLSKSAHHSPQAKFPIGQDCDLGLRVSPATSQNRLNAGLPVQVCRFSEMLRLTQEMLNDRGS